MSSYVGMFNALLVAAVAVFWATEQLSDWKSKQPIILSFGACLIRADIAWDAVEEESRQHVYKVWK